MLVSRQHATAGQPVRLAPRPAVLAGREALLAQLDAQFVAGDGSAPQTVSLFGLGGAGKTSVAVEYAYRHLAEVGIAWQFHAADTTVLGAGFRELAAQLGAHDLTDVRDPVATVHAVLARFAAPWLLIFDNALDMASVAAFLPPAGPGHVVITTQNPNWPGRSMHVPMLEPDAAADFLANRTGDPARQTAMDLADALGRLPLALEQAAAYIVSGNSLSLAEYLVLFRQRRAEMLARGEPAGYDKTVATTWALAFERLLECAPVSVGLLRLLAFCAPEAIPLRLLLQPRPGLAERPGDQVVSVLAPLLEDPLAVSDAIGALRKYSLVTPAEDGLVAVHRLVQAVTEDELSGEDALEWRQAAANLIEAAIPEDADDPETWTVFELLLPHAQAALAIDSDGLKRIADYIGQRGNYAGAMDLLRKIVDGRQRTLGADHPRTLASRNSLADLTGKAGDAVGARDQFAALLPVLERMLGADHRITVATRGNVAGWAWKVREAAGARNQSVAQLRDQYAEQLSFYQRTLGPDDLLTLVTRGNLAGFTGLAGDADGARDQYAELVGISERVLGSKHLDTLVARSNLAQWTGEAGDVAEACRQCAAVVLARRQILGREHPSTLGSRINLASFTGKAGNAAGARDQFAALLPVVERVLGPEHPDTLNVRGNLAGWTGEAGDAARAGDQFAALLPVVERVLGPEHQSAVTNRRNLSRWARKVDTSPSL
jgi:hypothetical protein